MEESSTISESMSVEDVLEDDSAVISEAKDELYIPPDGIEIVDDTRTVNIERTSDSSSTTSTVPVQSQNAVVDLNIQHVPPNRANDFADLDANEMKNLIGKRVSVYWKESKNYYPGEVVAISKPSDGGTHDVLYDDDVARGVMIPISEILVGPNRVVFKVIAARRYPRRQGARLH
jgi:hypothetical protein